jgi:2-succinyl-5-enolpyruvyl-6-hydroxy-3-cyclohexene-1-carboxylate synthase
MPIRDVEWFGEIPDGVTVHANRGANGIDGVIATAIGVALATKVPTALLIGDVAFVHDSAALAGLMSRGTDLRIVVIDNDGGGIFSFLPQASSLTRDRFEQLFGTPHGTDLVGLATAHGIPAGDVATLDQLRAALAEPGPCVIRVGSNRADNVAVHQRINDAVGSALALRGG